jgi:hypothetical protein
MCLALLSGVCYAAGVGSIQQVFSAVSVATENTITSVVFPIKSGGYFGAWIKVNEVACGKANLNFWVEESYDTDVSHFGKVYGSSNLISAFQSSTPTVITVSPSPMAYMRFRVEGVKGTIWEGNTTGTTVTMYLFKQD